jgi:Flp pilus assembly protein TadG
MKILKEENGQATVFMAAVLGVVLLAFLALAVDIGYLFQQKRMAQAAADAAAIAAAEEVTAGNSITSANVVNAANIAATQNGFNTSLTTNPAEVTLSQSNSGIYSNAGSAPAPTTWVTAVVSQPVSTFFLRAISAGAMKTMTVSASAVAAGGAAAQTCICLTGTSGTDLNMSNDAQLNAPGCGIAVNSSSSNAITVVGSAGVCASPVSAVATGWNNSSNINNGGNLCSGATPVQGGAPCNSGSISVPALPTGITCYANPINGWVAPLYNGIYTLPLAGEVPVNSSICYTSLNLSNAASVTFSPGYTYFVEGDFTTGGGAPVTGSGVTFVITGNINVANGVVVNLSAPTVNNAPGVLFYATGSTVTFQGGSNSNLSGLIYAPNAAVTLNNGTGATTNMDFYARTLTMAGGAALNSYATPLLGGGSGGGGVARLVQ